MIALSIGKTKYDKYLIMDKYPVEGQKCVVNSLIESSSGSACNVAHLVRKWGSETFLCSSVGYDDYGNFVKKEIEANKINEAYLETNYERATENTLIIINKENTSKTIIEKQHEIYHVKKSDFDIDVQVVYSDGTEYLASVSAFNKYQDRITVLGASVDNGSDFKEVVALIKYAKYIVMSLQFAETYTKMKADFNNSQTLLAIYQQLKREFPYKTFIVTLKNMGAMYQIGEEVKVMPTITVEEKDRSGAGDIFDGAFLYSLGNSYDLETAIRIANIAGGLSTTKYGAKDSIPELKEVTEYYEQRFGPLVAGTNTETQTGATPPIEAAATEQQVTSPTPEQQNNVQ